tara:strand:- start:2177 stop:2482 length:306 start_codon:yes stop_codon:yes gene_type:complete
MSKIKQTDTMQYGRHGEIRMVSVHETEGKYPPSEQSPEDSPDNCPVCKTDLYYSEEVTKRIAILDCEEIVTGWVCPSCYSEFDNKDNILVLMSKSPVQGES